MRSFVVASAMTVDTRSRSRDALRPRFAGNSSPSMVRGRREDRVRAAPAVSCAMCTKSAHTSIQVQRRASGLPCAMALRLIACSPRRTALLPPLRPEKQLPPGALTPAPRRQDHTSLPYASAALVCRSSSASTASPSHVRDDGRRPSGRDGMAIDIALIWLSDKAKYFLFRGLTLFPKIGIDLPVGQNLGPCEETDLGCASKGEVATAPQGLVDSRPLGQSTAAAR